METYYLVFAFDKECKNSIVLKEGTLEQLDSFTSKFDSSLDIRKRFKKEISDFCEKNNAYIKMMEEKNKRKETGDIVIYYIDQSKSRGPIYKRKRVLYKYSIKAFYEIIKNKKLMEEYARYSYINRYTPNNELDCIVLSEFHSKIIKFNKDYSVKAYDHEMAVWKKKVRESDKFYSTIRKIFEMCKMYNFEPLEKILTSYKNKQMLSKSKLEKTRKPDKPTPTNLETNKCEDDFVPNYDSYEEELNDLLHSFDYYDETMSPKDMKEYRSYLEEELHIKNKKH